MLRNNFPSKHLSMATGNFWSYCGQRLADLCLFTEVRYRIYPKKSVVKTLLNILLTAKWNDHSVVHSKQFTKIIGILGRKKK